MPAPTTVTRSPTSGAASHSALTAVSTVPASTARAGGTSSGTTRYRGGRYDVGGLVRVQAEDGAAEQLGRPLLDDADAQIAVLDRSREVALLERRPHRRVLVGRHAAPEHQRLGAAADARAHGAHHHVAAPRRGQRDRPDLPAAGRAHPERVCGSLIVEAIGGMTPPTSWHESITGSFLGEIRAHAARGCPAPRPVLLSAPRSASSLPPRPRRCATRPR